MIRRSMIVLFAVISLVAAGSIAAPQRAKAICNWGGTPAAPTGDVTVTPGLTATPAAGPLKLLATGSLTGGGRCNGTMTFVGFVMARSTCAQTFFFGKVKGVPGVARFAGPGVATMVHEFLYNKNGDIVGADQPILQVPQPDGYSHAQDCAAPGGFTHGRFSSTVELWG